MVRKLVTVRRVAAIRPIIGADSIQVAVVDGWACVVKIDEFKEGDLGVYFEIDSFLPANDARWEFLSKQFIECDGEKGFRVRTIKLRGQISQGLMLPISTFPEIVSAMAGLEKGHGRGTAEEKIMEMSFEEVLNVKKFERPEPVGGAGAMAFYEDFPGFINKTDQQRCQNLPGLFKDWSNETFQETTKMDGSSMTVYFVRKDSPMFAILPTLDPSSAGKAADQPNGRVGVTSRNKDIIEKESNLFWATAIAHSLPAKLATLNRNVAIQGELCGSSIQGNFEGFKPGFHDFYLFSVWDVEAQIYLPPKEAEQFAKDLGLKHVAVNGYFKLGDVAASVEELVARADGKGLNGKKREGIVFKHVGGGFSFKAISNSYLLKHGE
jgi:RNA ligase (TIGR02306 family)